jgi:hypothetical protein
MRLRFSTLAAMVALAATWLAGCDNACQQVCDQMAAYAEDCGISVSDDEVEACKDAQAGSASRDDRSVCRDVNSRRVIEEEWTCDDLSAYWISTGNPEATE